MSFAVFKSAELHPPALNTSDSPIHVCQLTEYSSSVFGSKQVVCEVEALRL